MVAGVGFEPTTFGL